VTGQRRSLLGIVLLLAGSVAAGLVVLVPAAPVALGAVLGLVLLPTGLWLVVGSLRQRFDGLRLSVEADPVLAEVVPRRYGDDSVRAWDLLVVAASAPGSEVAALREAAATASGIDDLADRLDVRP
jgi:hypothetical protein